MTAQNESTDQWTAPKERRTQEAAPPVAPEEREPNADSFHLTSDSVVCDLQAALPSKNKRPLIEIFWLGEGDDAFVCGASGHVTEEMLAEINGYFPEENDSYFKHGPGTYLFEARFNKGDRECEIEPHFELDEVGFVALEVESQQPRNDATPGPDEEGRLHMKNLLSALCTYAATHSDVPPAGSLGGQAQPVAPVAIPEAAILHRMKYHHWEADPAIPDHVADWELFDQDIECAGCIDVLIVRADAVATSDAALWSAYGEGRADEAAERAPVLNERAAFEAWAISYHGRHTLTDPDAGSMWSAWQARAALPGAAP